jgi:DNA-binding transcriptional regulator GbsR (MarR family)
MTKPTRPKNTSPFSWFFNHRDMIAVLDYLIYNQGKTVTAENIENHLGFSQSYMKANLLKHLQTTKIIKKTSDGYEFTTSQAAKSFLKLNEELEKARSELPVITETPQTK